jgi:hypothetical protein
LKRLGLDEVILRVPSSAFTLVSCSTYFSTLKMEATVYSETSVDSQRTTHYYIPEDGTLHNHCCENLKSYRLRWFFGWDFNMVQHIRIRLWLESWYGTLPSTFVVFSGSLTVPLLCWYSLPPTFQNNKVKICLLSCSEGVVIAYK